MCAIDKLRAIVAWANYQNETFNQKFKSIEDIEKAYDFVQAHRSIEYLDDLTYLEYEPQYQDEYNEINNFLKTLLK